MEQRLTGAGACRSGLHTVTQNPDLGRLPSGRPLDMSGAGSHTDGMAAPFEASSLQPGLRVLGRYELIRELGRGGMGVVWLVKDHGLGIECAFKFLPDVLRQDRVSLDELRDEARRNLRLT